MTKGKSVPNVISYKKHQEIVARLQSELQNMTSDAHRYKMDLDFARNSLKERLEDSQVLAATYGNLKRENEMLKAQYQNQLMADQVRLQDAIKDRNRAMGEAAGYFEKYMQASKPWYKKLFNIKTK